MEEGLKLALHSLTMIHNNVSYCSALYIQYVHLPPVQCTLFLVVVFSFTAQYTHIHFNLGFIFQITLNNVVSGSAYRLTSVTDAWNVNYSDSDVLESVYPTPNQIQEMKDREAFYKKVS